VHRNASLILFTASHAPTVELELLGVEDLGDNLHRIRVRASNRKAIPTLSQQAMRRNLVRKDIVRIEGDGLKVVSGGIVTDPFFDQVQYVEHRPWMIFTSVPSFGDRIFQWVVEGNGKATVTYDAIKATDRSLTVEF